MHWLANQVNQLGRNASDRGRQRVAEFCYGIAARLAPAWSTPWFIAAFWPKPPGTGPSVVASISAQPIWIAPVSPRGGISGLPPLLSAIGDSPAERGPNMASTFLQETVRLTTMSRQHPTQQKALAAILGGVVFRDLLSQGGFNREVADQNCGAYTSNLKNLIACYNELMLPGVGVISIFAKYFLSGFVGFLGVCRSPMSKRLLRCCTALALFGILFCGALRADVIYFTDSPRNIRTIAGDGSLGLFATLPVGTSLGGIAFGLDGSLYAADFSANSILKFTADGTSSTFATLPVSSSPIGVIFDLSGNMFVADYGTNTISKITPGGAVTQFASLPANSGVVQLAFDSAQNLYATLQNAGNVEKITPTGVVSNFTAAGTIPSAEGLTFDSQGNLFTVSYSTNLIYKITPGGSISPFYNLHSNAFPQGLATGSGDNIIAARGGFIDIIAPNGQFLSEYNLVNYNPEWVAVAVPEPTSGILIGLAGVGFLAFRRNLRRGS